MLDNPNKEEAKLMILDEKMDKLCQKCYQSSNCNWNRKESFIQIGENSSPDWDK